MQAWTPAFAAKKLPFLPAIRSLSGKNKPKELGQNTIPPFGLRPVPSGIIMAGAGLILGITGGYLAIKKAKADGILKFIFGPGGGGLAILLLGAIPLITVGTFQVVGGVLVKKLLDEYQAA